MRLAGATLSAHRLSFIPIDLVICEHGEVLQLELQGRHFCSADEPPIIFVRNSDAFCEVDHRKREPRRGLEGGHHTVREVLRTFEIHNVLREVERG